MTHMEIWQNGLRQGGPLQRRFFTREQARFVIAITTGIEQCCYCQLWFRLQSEAQIQIYELLFCFESTAVCMPLRWCNRAAHNLVNLERVQNSTTLVMKNCFFFVLPFNWMKNHMDRCLSQQMCSTLLALNPLKLAKLINTLLLVIIISFSSWQKLDCNVKDCPNMMRWRKTHFSITFINFSPLFPRGKTRSFDLPSRRYSCVLVY